MILQKRFYFVYYKATFPMSFLSGNLIIRKSHCFKTYCSVNFNLQFKIINEQITAEIRKIYGMNIELLCER